MLLYLFLIFGLFREVFNIYPYFSYNRLSRRQWQYYLTRCFSLFLFIVLLSGYCHEDCTISSTIQSTEEVEFLITCKQCYRAKALTQNENSNESPTSPLPLLGREYQNPVTAPKGSRQKDCSQPLACIKAPENCSNMLQTTVGSSLAAKSRRKPCSWGLIWKKKNAEDTGIDFRLKCILLRGNPDAGWSRPVCHLCHKPYNSDLMYLCCESCKSETALNNTCYCFFVCLVS